MATTTSKPSKRRHLRRTARSLEAGYSGRSPDKKPLLNEEIRPRSIAYDLNEAIEEEPKTASPAAAAFVSGAKASVPVLLRSPRLAAGRGSVDEVEEVMEP